MLKFAKSEISEIWDLFLIFALPCWHPRPPPLVGNNKISEAFYGRLEAFQGVPGACNSMAESPEALKIKPSFFGFFEAFFLILELFLLKTGLKQVLKQLETHLKLLKTA